MNIKYEDMLFDLNRDTTLTVISPSAISGSQTFHWEEWEERFIDAIGDPFLKEKIRELYGDMLARERQAQ